LDRQDSSSFLFLPVFFPSKMVLKLYGSPVSRLVAFVLREKEVPFEFVPVDLSKKEHKSPEYLEKQPFGQVPYIVCDVL
jgi:glutathione S-transferase